MLNSAALLKVFPLLECGKPCFPYFNGGKTVLSWNVHFVRFDEKIIENCAAACLFLGCCSVDLVALIFACLCILYNCLFYNPISCFITFTVSINIYHVPFPVTLPKNANANTKAVINNPILKSIYVVFLFI